MKIAMVSSWHVHAEYYAQQLQSDPRCEIVAVYDERQDEGRQWAGKLGCRFEPDYEALLSDPNVEAVAVCGPTNEHPRLLIRAAKAGKAIFTEKVMTLTYADAIAVKQAVEENRVLFTISFPHKCNPALTRAKEMADAGLLGKITYARVRNVHSGSVDNWLPPHFYDPIQCGGGAMIDLGAHPMYTLEWFLGKAQSVVSAFTNVTDRPVEDNAVSVIEFAEGAVGVSETGFVSRFWPYECELDGTEGAIRVEGGTLRYALKSQQGKWTECTDLPKAPKPPVLQWVDAFCDGKPAAGFGIDEAVSLSALMDAAYISHREGRKVSVPGQG